MIIIGYQGIGKSTLANEDKHYIDLESGCFWVDGKRDENWYKPYCNIAEHLSKQGYTVFVSSHEVVRKRLQQSSELIGAVVPSLNLKDEWIKKLEYRYKYSKLEKDYKAWKNAEDRYEDNIKEIINDCKYTLTIDSIDYDLVIELLKLGSIIKNNLYVD